MRRVFFSIAIGYVIISVLTTENVFAGNNRYLIWEDHKYGYIDSIENVVIPPQFDDASDFLEGLATVEMGRIYYYYAHTLTQDYVAIADATYLDSLESWQGAMIFIKHGRSSFIDTSGRLQWPPLYDAAGVFSDGLAMVNRGGQEYDEGDYGGGKWGYIDTTFLEVIPLKYDDVQDFSEGLAAVDSAGKWRYINKKGEYINEIAYDRAKEFSEGLAAVDSGGEWGYIDTLGAMIFSFQFARAESFEYGFALCQQNPAGDFFVIDHKGDIYSEGLLFYSEGYLIKMVQGKYGVFDSLGSELVSPQFEDARPFFEGKAVVKINGKWGYISPNGKYICKLQFDQAENFSGGMAAVKLGKDWGYIDTTGEMVIKPQYGSAGPFVGPLAQVGLKEKILLYEGPGKYKEGYEGRPAYIDKSGKVVWKAKKTK